MKTLIIISMLALPLAAQEVWSGRVYSETHKMLCVLDTRGKFKMVDGSESDCWAQLLYARSLARDAWQRGEMDRIIRIAEQQFGKETTVQRSVRGVSR